VALAPLENPLYYLANFQRVLHWLQQRYADLLDAEEQHFIDCFTQLPQPGQALLVRMIMRKGQRFRASKLNYPEIGCPRQAATLLLAHGLVDDQAPLALEHLFELLLKAEIVALFREHAVPASARKADLLQQLSELDLPARPFAEWCPALDEQVYSLKVQAVCDRLRLLFFGNLHQDWTEFVLADLGVYRYEQVPFDSTSRALRDRQDVLACLAVHRCAEGLEAGEPAPALLAELNAVHSNNPWVLRRRERLLFHLGHNCERQQDWPQALAIYQQCGYPGARARAIRVLELSGEFTRALALAEQALLAPESAAEAQQLPRMLPRLRRALGMPAQARAARASVARLDLHIARCEQPLSVEQRVLLHLRAEDGPVHYVENSLFNSLFGLLCWPAIFAALPGAFFHPFQSAPADLLQTDFRERRAALFQACLGRLDDGTYKAAIRECYQSKWGLQSPFVYWGALNEELLELALECLPAEHLKHCFERLLEDVKANRAGMPDLIQFWPAERRYRMIEVKGPGDRLQDNQLRWLDFCARHAMPVEVCYVQWQEHEREHTA
jgi:hypothetical protein